MKTEEDTTSEERNVTSRPMLHDSASSHTSAFQGDDFLTTAYSPTPLILLPLDSVSSAPITDESIQRVQEILPDKTRAVVQRAVSLALRHLHLWSNRTIKGRPCWQPVPRKNRPCLCSLQPLRIS